MNNKFDGDILSRNISALRAKSGLSVKAFAQKCDLAPQTISRIEDGDIHNPSMHVVFALANAFGYDVGQLFGPLYKEIEPKIRTAKPASVSGLGRTIGKNLKAYRARKKLTQPQLSKRTGVTQSDISRLERMKTHNPGAGVLQKLADGLDVPISTLLADSTTPPQALQELFDSPLGARISDADKIALTGHILPYTATSDQWYDIWRVMCSKITQ
jgi:transcriptional regulator with XRE-family HTH domain